MKCIKSIVLVLTMILLFSCGCSTAAGNNTAADFTLDSLDGTTVTLSKILKDKMVVLDFWTSWCPHCITAIPELGWVFSGWSGNITSSDNPLVMVIEGNTNLTASFIYQVFMPLIIRNSQE